MESKTFATAKSVLVALSESKLRYQCSSRLADEGFNVANVSDAIACLDALRCRAFDILVVEQELPLGRGEGIIELMGKDPQIETIPAVIIELSGDSTKDRGGASAPFALKELVQAIKSRLLRDAIEC